MNLNLRAVLYTQHRGIDVIGQKRLAFRKTHSTLQDSSKAPGNGALDLSFNAENVQGLPHVQNAQNAFHPKITAAAHGNISDLRQVRCTMVDVAGKAASCAPARD